MAKGKYQDSANHFNSILREIETQNFKPFYLFMGEEPYYSDMLNEAILKNAIRPEERDFNLTTLYGNETKAEQIISCARQFPMMSNRILVMVKEAQLMSKTELDSLVAYLEKPLETTILVVSLTGKSVDKRGKLYKEAEKKGVVFESLAIPEWNVAEWINTYLIQKGKQIDNRASALMAEATGNDLRKIVLECDKLIKALDDRKLITAEDIEKNVGISKEYNMSELTKALATRNAEKALRIALYFGDSPKRYPLVVTLGSLFYYFNKLLQYNAIVMENNSRPPADIASRIGVSPYFLKEYEMGARNYPLKKTFSIIAQIEECDYKSKSNAGGAADEKALLTELITKILV